MHAPHKIVSYVIMQLSHATAVVVWAKSYYEKNVINYILVYIKVE